MIQSATINDDSHSLTKDILKSTCRPRSGEDRKPALFLDRDGTLMKEVDHCHDPKKVEAIEGAARGLEKSRRQGWYNIIITNQSGIGRGYFTEKEFQAVQDELTYQLGNLIDATYMSSDLPNTVSLRRKPAPGMFLEAAQDLGINLAASFMIGDRTSDIEAGRAAGCRTILVLTGYGPENRNCGADFIVKDVTEAIDVALTFNPPISY